MFFDEIPKLKIGEHEARIPMVLGGMAVGISLSRLASAMAIEGGIGVIAATGIGLYEPDFVWNNAESNMRALRKQIRQAREKTSEILGVNIMVAVSDFDNLVRTSVEEGADVLFMGAGLPLKMTDAITMDQLRYGKTKMAPIVSSGRATRIIFEYWKRNFNHIPDAVVVEGPLAGGHLGFKVHQIDDENYRLEKLLPDVIEVVDKYRQEFGKHIPVIAAGGIYSGEDMYKIMKQGIDGVQMASRFIATHECDASLAFKEAVVKCKKEDIMIIESPVGMPGRAIKNKFLENMKAGEMVPFYCPWKCLKGCEYEESPFCIALALTNAEKGNFDLGFAFVGANAYKVDKIISVKELIETIKTEYNQAAANTDDA